MDDSALYAWLLQAGAGEELAAALVRPAWQRDAACRRADRHLFFPPPGQGPDETALACCAGCRVRPECLAFAVDHDLTDGIWGGTTPGQRADLERAAV